LLSTHWTGWNLNNSYTHRVFKHLLSQGNLSAQENLEEQALLANPCREAIEILIRKATYLSNQMGYMQFSLRYFEGALTKWEQLLNAAQIASHEDLTSLVHWQALTDYQPTIGYEKKAMGQEILLPLQLCETVTTICLRVGKYKRIHEIIMNDWPTVQQALSGLRLTLVWSEVERLSQKLQYLQARLMIREGDWLTALDTLSQLAKSAERDVRIEAASLELSLKKDQRLGIELLARQYPVPSMAEYNSSLAKVFLSEEKNTISHVCGTRIAAHVVLNEITLAARDKKAAATILDETRSMLHSGIEELHLVLSTSTSRYDDLQVFGELALYCAVFGELAYLCQFLAQVNDNDLSIKMTDILRTSQQLVSEDLNEVQDMLGLRVKDIPALEQFAMLGQASIQPSDLVASLKTFTSAVGDRFKEYQSMALDRAIRLGEHLGCADDLPHLFSLQSQLHMQAVATLPEESPERKRMVAEITDDLRKALAIADLIGRVDTTESICTSLGIIYNQFLVHYSRAAEHFRRAAETCCRLGMPNFQVGWLYRQAAVVYHNAGVLYPEQDQMHAAEQECLLRAREYFVLAEQEDEYIQAYSDFLRSSIIHVDLDLAERHLEQGEFEQTLLFADDLITRIPTPATDLERRQKGQALMLRGQASLAMGKRDDALDALEDAYQLFRDFDSFHEIQTLEGLVRITAPRYRQMAGVALIEEEREVGIEKPPTELSKEQYTPPPHLAEILVPGREVMIMWLGADLVTVLFLVGQGDVELLDRLDLWCD
jgi:tetratricopeptide (TPR) repeat protein